MSSSSSKNFILKSSDGETFEIDETAAAASKTIKRLIEAGVPGNVIPLPNVTGSILAKVVEYCKKHAKIHGKDSESKLSLTKIDCKDSESKLSATEIDCKASESKLSATEIDGKDSESKSCNPETKYRHFLAEQAIDDDIGDQDCQALAKLAMDDDDICDQDCQTLAELAMDDEIEIRLKSWDAEFVKVDQKMLFDLIMAADYLEMESLADLTCNTVADMIRGRSPEEMRWILNIKNDFTEEDEKKVLEENKWAFL